MSSFILSFKALHSFVEWGVSSFRHDQNVDSKGLIPDMISTSGKRSVLGIMQLSR